MACLFGCFRVRYEQSTSDSVSVPSLVESRRSHESKNRLSALFFSEEKEASSPCHERDGSVLDSMHIDKVFKDEVQFLKACETTPIELTKASEKLETPEYGKHFGNSCAVFHLDEKTDEPSEAVSEQTPKSCLTDARSSTRISTGLSDAGEESIGTTFKDGMDITGKMPLTAGNITRKRKSVRFVFDLDQYQSSSSTKTSTSIKSEMAGETNIIAISPNPASLKLSDEIQTHGTIFPANRESQFVQSASNITESYSLFKLLEDSDESQDKTDTESTTSVTFGGKLEEISDESYQIGESETSLSPKMKQSEEECNTNMSASSTIALGDRPIIGMVAAHWNEKEQSQTPPKLWDGKGIPNSTNKYKEDQKVSWHAATFEERLEKALSEESGQSFILPRKFGNVEETERDTAISKLQHSAQFKSVVSF
ncbi:unnamed protein product [Cochlearia groenlandica]